MAFHQPLPFGNEEKAGSSRSAIPRRLCLWGGLVPGHLDDLEPMSEAGVVGFKAFMSSPGDEGEEAFREVDDLTLWEGMKRIARMNRVLALHAESESLVSRLGRVKQAEGAYHGQRLYVHTPDSC